MTIKARIMAGYLSSILLVAVVGVIGFAATTRLVSFFPTGEEHFRSIVARAMDVAACAKMMSGDLKMHLLLGDKREKAALTKYYSLLQGLSFLDEQVKLPAARSIVDDIKRESEKILPLANALMGAHDADLGTEKGVAEQSHRDLLREFDAVTSRVREKAVQLAELETDFLNRQVAISSAGEVGSYAERMAGHMQMYLLLNDGIEKQKALARYASLSEHLSVLDAKMTLPDAKKILDEIRRNSDNVLQSAKALIAAHDKDVNGEGRFIPGNHATLIRELDRQLSDVRDKAMELTRLNVDLEAQKRSEILSQSATLTRNILLVLAGSLVTAVVLGYALSKSTITPIAKLTKAAIEIGKGNLDTRIEIQSKDEIGILANAFRDMTKALRETTVSRDYVENIIASMNECLVGLTADWKIVKLNQAALELWGYAEEELLNKPIGVLFEGERFEQTLADSVKKGRVRNLEAIGLTKDGRQLSTLFSASPLQDRDGNISGIVCVARDISELKRVEEEKESLRNQLSSLQKIEAIGTLTGGIAHDFNNLLTIMNGFTEMVLMDTSENDPRHEDLVKILETGRKGATMVEGLLAFSKKAEITLQPLNLNQVITRSVALMERTFPKMIEIETILSDELGMVNADAVQVEQVLMNLCINAKEAMPDGGKIVIECGNTVLDEAYCRLHVGAKPGRHVLIQVSDNGVGMERETVDRMFDPFFTTKGWDFKKGTGLGLSVAKGIVEQHGGRITCQSEPAKGTTFTIFFPVLEDSPEVQEPKFLTESGAVGAKILLIDDEEYVRELARRILERAGYMVITASNGREALDIYAREKSNIALVVLDLIMPQMGGEKCLEELLRMNPKVRVVLSSGHSLDQNELDRLNVSVRGNVDKPY